VTTETVPVERVRLGKDQVQEQQAVDVDVRKEQIDTETDAGRRPADDDR
jgi:stress response protein YsnF